MERLRESIKAAGREVDNFILEEYVASNASRLLPSSSRFEWQTWHTALAFHKVLTTDPWSTSSNNSPLFALPSEILMMITSHIQVTDLRAFAAVNSDCYRLAQTGRWLRLLLNYNALKELGRWRGLQKLTPNGTLQSSRRGAPMELCVRHLELYHNNTDLTPIQEQIFSKVLSSCVSAMPNPEAFVCSKLNLSSEVIMAVFRSNVKHLGLHSLRATSKDGTSFAELTAAQPWPLENLQLTWVSVDASFLTDIIQSCSQSLRRIRLEDLSLSGRVAYPVFPVLQEVNYAAGDYSDMLIISSLLDTALVLKILGVIGGMIEHTIGDYIIQSSFKVNLRAIGLYNTIAADIGLSPLLQHCPKLQHIELVFDGGISTWDVISDWAASLATPNTVSILALSFEGYGPQPKT